jgi:hypothetical protein
VEPLFRLEQRGQTLCAVLQGDEAELFLFGEHRKWIAEQVWPALANHNGPKSIIACGLEWSFVEEPS